MAFSASACRRRWSRRSRCSLPRRPSLLVAAASARSFSALFRCRYIERHSAVDRRLGLSRRFRLRARSAHAGHAAGRHRRRLPHPSLLGRLHGARRGLLALLRLPEPLHVLHADAGAGGELPADVRRLGGRRPRLLPADRLLLQRSTPPPTPAARRSSSTASATSASCWRCSC